MHYLVSTCILVILGVGLYYRHDVKRHATAMISAFVLDVGLVLAIELQKQAINTFVETVQNPEGEALLLFHIGVSLTTIVLYAVLTVLGFKIMKGKRELLTLHRNLAGVFIVCRLTNYVTSFMVGSP